MPGDASTPTIKPKEREVNLDVHRILDPHELAFPAHIIASMKARWNKTFPLSDLAPRNCGASDKIRLNRETKKLVIEDEVLVTKDIERDATEDDRIDSTEFITAGNRLVTVVEKYFEPRNRALQLSGQVALHFDTIIKRADYTDNFLLLRLYSAHVLRNFSAHANFDVSVWQPEVWTHIRERNHDRKINRILNERQQQGGSGNSFRGDGPSGSNPPLRESFRGSFREDGAGQQGGKKRRKEGGAGGSCGGGAGGSASNMEDRCIYCDTAKVRGDLEELHQYEPFSGS
ncbi:hypothetical protein B0H14DRAFT_2626167 [Mycena olivaceomarginata]|nr:hypothetical protein B0H14DRAFT_2626167 [Mycena olivaceomarginata]